MAVFIFSVVIILICLINGGVGSEIGFDISVMFVL